MRSFLESALPSPITLRRTTGALVSLGVTELWVKLGSFTLELVAFAAIWLTLDRIGRYVAGD